MPLRSLHVVVGIKSSLLAVIAKQYSTDRLLKKGVLPAVSAGGREGNQLGSCRRPGKYHKPDLRLDGAPNHLPATGSGPRCAQATWVGISLWEPGIGLLTQSCQ